MSRTAEQKEEIDLVDGARKLAYKIHLSVWTLLNWQCWLPPQLLLLQHSHRPQHGLSFELRRIEACLQRCPVDGMEDVTGNVLEMYQGSNEVPEKDIAAGLDAGWDKDTDSKEDRNVAALHGHIDYCF